MAQLEKDQFIKELTSMTIEEINNLIKEKGKKPKPEPVIYFVDEEKRDLI